MSSTTTTGPADLPTALAALAAADALTVGADGFNPHFQYAYMTEDSLFKAARAALAEVGLSGTISFEGGQHESITTIHTDSGKEKLQTLATVTAVLAIRDTQGNQVEVRAFGQGLDPADKAYAKAMTMAAKYVVQKGLMIGVEHGDDTDAGGDAGDRKRSGGTRRASGGGGGAASEKQLGFLCVLVKKGHYIEDGTQDDVEHVALRLARMQAGAEGASITAFKQIPKGVASDLIEKLQLIPEHRAPEVLEKLAEWEAQYGPPTGPEGVTSAAEAAASPAPTPPAAAPSDDDDIPF